MKTKKILNLLLLAMLTSAVLGTSANAKDPAQVRLRLRRFLLLVPRYGDNQLADPHPIRTSPQKLLSLQKFIFFLLTLQPYRGQETHHR